MNRIRFVLALGACVAVALPAAAAAQPGQRTFDQTYPYASRLCAAVAAGHAPKRLAASSGQVSADCAQLGTSFTSAQSAYTTAAAALKQQAATVIASTRDACRQARANHDRGACVSARSQALGTLGGIRAQVKAAAQAYHQAVDAARKTFWSAIRALRGGSSVKPDRSIHSVPETALPSDSSVSNA